MGQPSGDSGQLHNFPPQPALFIGRDTEVGEISRQLVDPGCRLLTLFGPGGIGKTRLAARVALEIKNDFAHGIFFVSLQPVQSAVFLASAIADALKFSLSGQAAPEIQLLNYLGDKELLLLLDNFEQLLAPPPARVSKEGSPQAANNGEAAPDGSGRGGAELLARILEAAPLVKLLVTSREVLNLQEEWLYPVQGLAVPGRVDAGDLEAYGAVQLFIERARRVRRDFSPASEPASVARVCQLVEGVPLALEIAAAWIKTLPCRTIAAEIQRNIDFLTTNLRDVPERQRSMRAVFDQSWKLLSRKERNVFKRLSVFRGGFQHEAAERVAGATLATLSALVDKSLLRSEANGRYQIHELLRQYAAEQLVQSPQDVARVYDLYCAYYANFLNQRAEAIEGGRQSEATREIAADLENVRASWQWAVQQVSVENIHKSTYTFYHFCDFQGRYLECAGAFEQAIEKLDEADPAGQKGLTLALLLVLLGFLYIRLGRFEKAKAVFERGQTIFHHLKVAPPPGFGTDPLIGLGVLANILGDYKEAARLAKEARRLSEARADKQNHQVTFYILANAAFAQGQYEAARRYAQQAYTLTQETNNRWMMAYVLSDLGNIARALGDYEQARQYYQASYAMKQEFNDPEGIAAALNHLARIAWLQQAYEEAEQLYRQSQKIYREINDRGGLATSFHGLGNIARALGHYQTACHYFHQALQIAADIYWVPLMLSILLSIGELLRQPGQVERCVELVALALHHPASDYETKAKAQQLLRRFEAELPPAVFAAATQRGAAGRLEAEVTTVQAHLATLSLDPPQLQGQAQAAEKLAGSPALVEALTSRELEVLRLIAEGRTNEEIAGELIISAGTVKWYSSQIYGKLNVSNRTQAVARGRELGLLSG